MAAASRHFLLFSVPSVPLPPARTSFSPPPLLTAPLPLFSPTTSRRVLAMASYNVTLRMPGGLERSFLAPDDDYILVTAEDLDDPPLDLPSSCRSGACSACCAKLISGDVDQSDGSFLTDDQIKAGFVLTCVAYPLSDVVLQTHADSELK